MKNSIEPDPITEGGAAHRDQVNHNSRRVGSCHLNPDFCLLTSTLLIWPLPITNFREIISAPANVPFVFHQFVSKELFEVGPHSREARHAVHNVAGQVETVEVIHHGHIKRRCGGPFFLIAPYVHVGMVGSAIGQAMD
jgi:hypothetical protein